MSAVTSTDNNVNNINNTQDDRNDDDDETSWIVLRSKGRDHYKNGEYDAAYYVFSTAYTKMIQQHQQQQQQQQHSDRRMVQTQTTNVQQQLQLQYNMSLNVIACRLQIGGIVHIERAIQECKDCIALHPTWSLAYIRLAVSYMALRQYQYDRNHRMNRDSHNNNNNDGYAANYSNDICNALQTAIRYGSTSGSGSRRSCSTGSITTARQLLLQELRNRNNNNDHHHSLHPTDENPPPINPNYTPPSSSTLHGNDYSAQFDPSIISLEGFDDDDTDDNNDGSSRTTTSRIDRNNFDTSRRFDSQQWVESILNTVMQSFHRHVQQIQMVWYDTLSSNHRKAIIAIVILLLLYAGSNSSGQGGGRGRKMKGNYGRNNIYEQHRREKLQRQQQQQQQYYTNPYQQEREEQYQHSNTHTHHQHHHPPESRYYDDRHSRRTTTNRSTITSSSSFEMNGIIYIAIIAVAVYIGNTYFGINPWQMIMFLRVVQNGGGYGRGGYGFGGIGGFGMGRQQQHRFHHHHRPRGYW